MTKIGLIGVGGIAERHRPAYEDHPDEVTLAGVCDVDEAAAREFAAGFDVDHWTDYETFLREADVDAVDVAMPHDLHYPVVKAALEAGKHVLIEKPFATSLSDCVELVELAEERGLTLMVGQMQRFYPPYRALKERVEDGDLGAIRHARCDVLVNQGDMVPDDHWLYDGELSGGGAVIGYAVHKIDLLRYLLGDVERGLVGPDHRSKLRRSRGLLRGPAGVRVRDDGGLLRDAVGARDALHRDVLAVRRRRRRAHAAQWPAGGGLRRHPGSPDQRGRRPDGRKGFEELSHEDTGLPTDDPFVDEILHFADCIETGAESISSGRDNLGTMAAIFSIYESADRDGDGVSLDDLRAAAREEV